MMTDIQTAELTYRRGNDELRGYAAWPTGSGPWPALVLVHDVRGLYDHYRDVTRRFAAEGFLTFVPDLYSREGPPELPDMDAVARWISELPDPRVLADIEGAVNTLAARADIRAGAIGITGFCLGGQYALMAACTIARLSACVSWYGMLRYTETNERKPKSPLELAPRLGCPYLGLFGADDALIPQADVEELRSTLERSGKSFRIKSYTGAGHAFFNDTRADAYRPEAAADAWSRARSFTQFYVADGVTAINIGQKTQEILPNPQICSLQEAVGSDTSGSPHCAIFAEGTLLCSLFARKPSV